MELLRLQEADFTKDDTVFKDSILHKLIPPILFTGLLVATIFWYKTGNVPLFVVILLDILLGLIALISFLLFAKSFSPSNWLVALNSERILIKFISYLNNKAAKQAPQIVSLKLSEIRSIKITKQELIYFSTSSSKAHHLVKTRDIEIFLDITINSNDLERLTNAIKQEHKMTRSYIHYPVSILQDQQTIRVEWNAKSNIKPCIQDIVDLLSRSHIKVEPELTENCDYTKIDITDEKLRSNILELAARGRTSEARNLVKKAYSLNTTEAVKFIKNLFN